MESLANGAGEGVVDRLVVLSNRPVPVPETSACRSTAAAVSRVRSVWMQFVLPGSCGELRPDLVHFTNYLAPLRAARRPTSSPSTT